MPKMPQSPGVTKYQFEIDDDEWERWKDTVPRSKTLDERIRELIEADRNGRVLEPSADRSSERTRERDHAGTGPSTPASAVDVPQNADLRERLDALEFPDPQKEGYTREDRVDLLATVYQRLEDADGDWVTRDELRDLFETMPAGYTSESSWYERFVREWLPELEEVEKSGKGASGMRIREAPLVVAELDRYVDSSSDGTMANMPPQLDTAS